MSSKPPVDLAALERRVNVLYGVRQAKLGDIDESLRVARNALAELQMLDPAEELCSHEKILEISAELWRIRQACYGK